MSQSVIRLLRCEAAGQQFTLNKAYVLSIRSAESLLSDPDEGSAQALQSTITHPLAGWLSIGGGQIPVADLTARLQAEPPDADSIPEGGNGKIVVVGDETSGPLPRRQSAWGLLVDRIRGEQVVERRQLLPLPPSVATPDTRAFEALVELDSGLALQLELSQLDPRSDQHDSASDDPAAAGDQADESADPVGDQADESAELAGDQAGESADPQAPGAGPSAGRDQAEAAPSNGREPESPPEPGRLVVFSTASSGESEPQIVFGLSASQVPEILGPPPSIPLPGAEPHVLGLFVWRGRAVPLIDLSLRMGMQSEIAQDTSQSIRLILARDADRPQTTILAGVLVHASVETLDLPALEAPSPTAHPLQPELVRGAFELDGQTLIVPHLARLLQPVS